MEEKRSIVKFFFDEGKSASEIFHLVKNRGINRKFIERTIKRLRETGSIHDRPRSGRPRTARTKQVVKVVRERLRRNPARSQRRLGMATHTSQSTIHRIIREDIGFKPYRKRKVHGLKAEQLAARLKRCKALLARHDSTSVEKIIFCDEKLFVKEQSFNPKNDVVYALSVKDIPEKFRSVQRYQGASSTMVWGAISHKGKFPLTFIEKGVKINAQTYQQDVLRSNLAVNADRICGKGNWIFQQDSAPAHKAKSTQDWCRTHCPSFISTSEWPPSSPDLNPLDYCIWGVLESRVNSKIHRSLGELDAAIQREWKKLSMDTVRAAIGSWLGRLKKVVKARGARFEQD